MRQSIVNSEEGFSLLEISIALIIIGLIGGFGLSAMTAQFQNRSIRVTKDHQEKVMRMLAAHVIKTGSLPLPSNPSAPRDQRGHQGGAQDYQGASIGIIPYITLGIPEKVAKDGWGRYFTYAMSTNLFNFTPVQNSHNLLDAYLSQTDSTLIIQDQNSSRLSSSGDLVSVILVSHGKYGHGAFDAQGKQKQALVHGPLQETNATLNPIYVDAPLSITKDAYFDDIVTWATRYSLLVLHGNAPHLVHRRTPER